MEMRLDPQPDGPLSAISWREVTERFQARFGHWMHIDVAEPERTPDGHVIPAIPNA